MLSIKIMFLIKKITLHLMGEDLTPLIIKGIKSTVAIGILFIIEIIISCLALALDNFLTSREKKYKLFKIFSIPILIFAIWPLSIPLMIPIFAVKYISWVNNIFFVLHSSKVVTLIFAICSFAITSIIFDVPSWQKDFSNYTLRSNAKFYKYIAQLSIAAFTIGMSIWQHIPWNSNLSESNKNLLSLYSVIAFFGFLPYTIVMLISLAILKPGKSNGLFYHLYKKNNHAIYLSSRKTHHRRHKNKSH